MVYVREMKSHKLYKKYELKFRPANITFSSDFSFCLIKVPYVEAIFYYDLNTMEYTKLLESKDFLPFSNIALTPDENHFITGVNGNRLLQYKLHKEGVAPENI